MKVIITETAIMKTLISRRKSCLMRGLNLNSHVPEQKMK